MTPPRSHDPAREERSEAGDLREAVQFVEAAEDRMILRHLDPSAIRKQQLHLLLEVGPFGRPVKVVHHRDAASREVLAENRHFVRLQPHAAGLHEVDPWVLEEALVVDGEEDRVFDLDRGRRLHAARKILFGRRRVDAPGFAVEILLNASALELVVVLHPDEAPLQARETIVGRRGELCVHARLERRHQREQPEQRRDHRDPVRLKPDATYASDGLRRVSRADAACFGSVRL